MKTDLRHVSIGDTFARVSHPHWGAYTVLDNPHGSIGIVVRTAFGKVGELYVWTRVVVQKPA